MIADLTFDQLCSWDGTHGYVSVAAPARAQGAEQVWSRGVNAGGLPPFRSALEPTRQKGAGE